MWMNHSFMAGHGFMGGFMWIFWIALLVALAFLIKGAIQSGQNNTKSELNSIQILKRRYVHGEIEQAEYEQKKKDLLS